MPLTSVPKDDAAKKVTAELAAQATQSPLSRDPSYLGMAATQFLGAFNDNLFKQLILLLATPTAAQLAAKTGQDRQGVAQGIFAAGFLIFSGFAGYLSDRYSKRLIVVSCKLAEIVIMLLGVVGFLMYDVIGFNGMLIVLLLMGTHSAFFGPAKYGILPELVRQQDLPRANGMFLMLTFLAIIFGTALAGRLQLWTGGDIWEAQLVCVGIAVLGTLTSLYVRPLPAAQPGLAHRWSTWGLSRDVRHMLSSDHELIWALVASSMFWMVGAMVLPAVNALGKTQLGLADGPTSLMAASIGAGIAGGCLVGGYLSRGRVKPRMVTIGAFGTVAALALLCLPGPTHGHLLGFGGSIPVLVMMGAFAGIFVVPVQVLLQSRPPRDKKGQMIGAMNQFQWVGVVIGAVIFQLCVRLLEATGGPQCAVFGVTAVLMLPVALFYRPKEQALVNG